MAAKRIKEILIWKIMDEKGIWSEDKTRILQVFSNEFCKTFKRTQMFAVVKPSLFSKDISVDDNKWLTMEVSDNEV